MLSLLLAAVIAAPQTELPRDVLLLARIRRKVEERISRMPNFTCVKTIQRWRRPQPNRPFIEIDTVRLEVAHVDGNEIYSWPGARSFEDRNPGEIIGAGTTSTGDFTGHLLAVFSSGSTTFTFRGEEKVNGKPALRWDVRLPVFGVRWTIRVGDRAGDSGARGSFWADPETLDLLRLELIAEDIPPDVLAADVVNRVDFGKVTIGKEDVLLPQTAELLMTDIYQVQDRNVTRFSDCRQYAGRSSISFEEPVNAGAAAPRALAEFEVQAGLDVVAALAIRIDSRTARVGDPVEAHVSADVKQGKTVVLPKGALVRGRVRRVEKGHVWLEFVEAEFDNRRARLRGSVDAWRSRSEPGTRVRFRTAP